MVTTPIISRSLLLQPRMMPFDGGGLLTKLLSSLTKRTPPQMGGFGSLPAGLAEHRLELGGVHRLLVHQSLAISVQL